MVSHAGRHNTVANRRGTAALDVTQNGHAGINTGGRTNAVCNILCMSDTLCDDDDVMLSAADAVCLHLVDDHGIKIGLSLREQDCGCAARNSYLQRQMSGTTSHDLNDRAALMRLHGITQAVDCADRRVARGIKTDGIVRAHDVVVDRSRNADCRHAQTGECLCAAEAAVAAADNQTIQSHVMCIVRRLMQTFLGQHLQAARGIQHSTALGDDAVYASCAQIDDVPVNQSAVAAANADTGDAVSRSSSDNAADYRIHSRRIAAARQNANTSDLFFHFRIPPHDLRFVRFFPL